MLHQITITTEKLKKLAMLADWQLEQMGISPESVTTAILDEEEANEDAKYAHLRKA